MRCLSSIVPYWSPPFRFQVVGDEGLYPTVEEVNDQDPCKTKAASVEAMCQAFGTGARFSHPTWVPCGNVSELACRWSQVHKCPHSPARKMSKHKWKTTAGNAERRIIHTSSYVLFLILTCAGNFLPIDKRSLELGGSAAAKHGTDEGPYFYDSPEGGCWCRWGTMLMMDNGFYQGWWQMNV